MSGSTTSNFTRAMPEFAAWESFYMFDDTAHAKRVFESEAGKKMMELKTDEPYGNRLYGAGLPQFLQQQASHTD